MTAVRTGIAGKMTRSEAARARSQLAAGRLGLRQVTLSIVDSSFRLLHARFCLARSRWSQRVPDHASRHASVACQSSDSYRGAVPCRSLNVDRRPHGRAADLKTRRNSAKTQSRQHLLPCCSAVPHETDNDVPPPSRSHRPMRRASPLQEG